MKAIQDAVHILTYELEREPTWEELSAALDRLNAGKENINETTLTFYQWVEEFISESEEHRTNAEGQKLHPRTIAKYRTVHIDARKQRQGLHHCALHVKRKREGGLHPLNLDKMSPRPHRC